MMTVFSILFGEGIMHGWWAFWVMELEVQALSEATSVFKIQKKIKTYNKPQNCLLTECIKSKN